MRLSLLSTTPVLCAHHDDAADILFLELQGHLTLAKAQAAGAQVVRLALPRHYTRVIISTCQLSTLEPAALYWLRQVLAPGLQLLGVRKLAWVCQSAPAGLALVHSLLAGLPVVATLFNDLEHAANWLPGCSGELAQQGPPAALVGTALATHSLHAPAMSTKAGAAAAQLLLAGKHFAHNQQLITGTPLLRPETLTQLGRCYSTCP
jgi:hypothetical protein